MTSIKPINTINLNNAHLRKCVSVVGTTVILHSFDFRIKDYYASPVRYIRYSHSFQEVGQEIREWLTL